MHDFELVTAGIPVTREENLRALQQPLEQLPELTESELASALRFKKNPETSRRSKAARRLAEERERVQGTALAEALAALLSELKSEFKVRSVRRSAPPDSWSISLVGDGRDVRFSMPISEVERWLIGSVSNRELESFRSQVAEAFEPRRLMKTAG